MKICITGTSAGIGEYLLKNLGASHSLFGVSRRKVSFSDYTHFQGDMREKFFLEKVAIKIDCIDYVVINAGVGYFGKFVDIEEQKTQEMIETNLLSPILFIHKLLIHNKIQKGIIFIGSYAGKKSMKFGATYMASKFGLRGLAMGLKNELSLSVHIINPKIVETDFYKNTSLDMSKFPHTEKAEILQIIEEIISGKEKRFEIDL